jgi:hypothetical protein
MLHRFWIPAFAGMTSGALVSSIALKSTPLVCMVGGASLPPTMRLKYQRTYA